MIEEDVQSVQGKKGIEVPLPNYVEGKVGQRLRKGIFENVTTKNIRRMDAERERNYFLENGLLKHKMDGEVGKMWVRLVLPAGRCKLMRTTTCL